MLWIGVDVGGTFTDGVVYDDETKKFRFEKSSSTPKDPVLAVTDVIDLLGLDLSSVGRFAHGITIGTNAVLEKKGASVWLLTTKGFRDVLDIARTNRHELYNIRTQKVPPILPRTRSLEIDERMNADGSVLRALDEDEVRETLKASCIATSIVAMKKKPQRSRQKCCQVGTFVRRRRYYRSIANTSV